MQTEAFADQIADVLAHAAVASFGDLVVDAIRRNALYINTHKETEAYIKRRFDRITEAVAHAL